MTTTAMAARLAPSWLRRPRPTARLRLTIFYSGLFILSSICLLAIPYLLVRNTSTGTVTYNAANHSYTYVGPDRQVYGAIAVPQVPGAPRSGFSNGQSKAVVEQLRSLAVSQHASELHQLLVYSLVALAVMAALSILLGWFVAGRVLRPIRTINRAACTISASNLHERLALTGPDDEFKELGATLDDLLNRLERSFESQRRFVANASHELRTPLAAERTLLQVALANTDASAASLRETCEKVLVSGQKQAQLIDALLTLASSDRGLEHLERLDLAELTKEVLSIETAHANRSAGLDIKATIAVAEVLGDPMLLKQLLSNLIDNAQLHNVPGGWIHVATGTRNEQPFVSVENTGAMIPASEVDRLLQPFQRLGRERTVRSGHGLGLTIVAAVAAAHHAELRVQPRSEGGLIVEVSFDTRPTLDFECDLLGALHRKAPCAVGVTVVSPLSQTSVAPQGSQFLSGRPRSGDPNQNGD